MAPWYGPGFHGRKTSAGAYYDEEDLTAASIDFPLGSRVMVTNLDNGRSVEVTITDRGPFLKGRKIDLSHKAARVIGMIDPGTARVRISLISKPAGTREVGAPLRYSSRLDRLPSKRTRSSCEINWPLTIPTYTSISLMPTITAITVYVWARLPPARQPKRARPTQPDLDFQS